jgi:pimeloyl-ACP methyl ester carboxylesterase
VREYLASTVLVGRISTAFPGKGPIIVAAYAKNQGKREVVHYTVLHDFGEYELMVAKGNYYVFAYWDKNSNLVYDAGEPAGQYGDPKMVTAPAGGVVGGLNIAIAEKPQNIDVPSGFEVSSVKPHKLYSRLAGAIIDLDDELFSEENGGKGYWEGISFFKEFGGNIYFLEEYDPRKIPILFIHGAGGTPKGWKYFADNIDRTRFQPWFFYYPSGARIPGMSHLLLWKLENLKLKYNFEQLYITAHSMGGLVARSFIMDHSGRFPYVKLFISLATPWGGAGMAGYGVKQSPAVVPCWIDLQPESAFIQSPALYTARPCWTSTMRLSTPFPIHPEDTSRSTFHIATLSRAKGLTPHLFCSLLAKSTRKWKSDSVPMMMAECSALSLPGIIWQPSAL